ncbi:MAG: FkbM family methyltransferase, partial [Bacteroidota bacterium]|nr:FkbM family methyltransferase [Bacteroidota bacterium]
GWEKISLRLWEQLAQRSDVIFDIGANTGIYSLIAGTVNRKATIIAVEPIQRVYKKLVHNIGLNGLNITPLNVAISDHDGTAPIYDQVESEHVLAVSLQPGWNQPHIKTTAVEVSIRTVASIMEELSLPRVDLLKIDVEGHELSVLNGFKQIIEQDQPSMLLELLSPESAETASALIARVNYVFYSIDERTWPPEQVDRLEKSRYHNVLICLPEVARKIGLSVRN